MSLALNVMDDWCVSFNTTPHDRKHGRVSTYRMIRTRLERKKALEKEFYTGEVCLLAGSLLMDERNPLELSLTHLNTRDGNRA